MSNYFSFIKCNMWSGISSYFSMLTQPMISTIRFFTNINPMYSISIGKIYRLTIVIITRIIHTYNIINLIITITICNTSN